MQREHSSEKPVESMITLADEKKLKNLQVQIEQKLRGVVDEVEDKLGKALE